METLIEIAVGIEVILIGDGGDEDQEGKFPFFATGLTGSAVVVAFGFTRGGDKFAGGKVKPVADIGDFFAPALVVVVAKFANQLLDPKERGFIGFGGEIEGSVEAVCEFASEVLDFAIEDVGGLEPHVGAGFPFEQAERAVELLDLVANLLAIIFEARVEESNFVQDLFVEANLESLFVPREVILSDMFVEGFKTIEGLNIGIQVGMFFGELAKEFAHRRRHAFGERCEELGETFSALALAAFELFGEEGDVFEGEGFGQGLCDLSEVWSETREFAVL